MLSTLAQTLPSTKGESIINIHVKILRKCLLNGERAREPNAASFIIFPSILNFRRDHMLSNGFSLGPLIFFESEFKELSFLFILPLLFFFFALPVLELLAIFKFFNLFVMLLR